MAPPPQSKKSKHEQHVEKIEALLPWGLENRVSALLIVIKLPLIILIGFIGLCAELTVKASTEEAWSRSGSLLPGGQTACYTHRLGTSIVANFGDFGLIETINSTFFHGGINQSDIFKHNLTIDPLGGLVGPEDWCHMSPDKCELPDMQPLNRGLFGIWGGINHLIPFALLWVICKSLYIGIHPVDRAVKQMHDEDDPPEPIFKLLTEPYFQKCTSVMFVIMKVFHFIRYRFMPNALLGALVSMQAHDICPHMVIYRMHWFWGTLCYYLVFVDVVWTVLLYLLAKTLLGGKLIGTNMYRLYKTCWFLYSILITQLPFWAMFYTFGGITSLIRAISRFYRLVLALDFRFAISVDMLKVLSILVVIMEIIELNFFLIGLCCPPLLGVLPCCACLKDFADSDDSSDASSSASEYEPLATNPSANGVNRAAQARNNTTSAPSGGIRGAVGGASAKLKDKVQAGIPKLQIPSALNKIFKKDQKTGGPKGAGRRNNR